MITQLECSQILDSDGIGHSGEFRLEHGCWDVYQIETDCAQINGSSYIASGVPVDFHLHGIGGIDLSNLDNLDLRAADQALSEERLAGVLTFFLPRYNLKPFCDMARAFRRAKGCGEYPHILGLAIEGPLLSSPGGTHSPCVWSPTEEEWDALAACGEFGLKYIVISPDASDPAPDALGRRTSSPPIRWIVELLLDAGISPTLGHFHKTDPESAAQRILDILEIASRRAAGNDAVALLSDHLFNDMPLQVPHAWRTVEAKSRRRIELERMQIDDWRIENVSERLGAVPGALIRGAHDGLITLCLNFDGEHVDLAIARQIVRVAGADHIIALTDRVDGRTLAGQRLFRSHQNRLLYRQDGVVVAGSTSLDEQIANMRRIGISEEEIWKMVSINPYRVLGLRPRFDEVGRPSHGSFVESCRSRDIFETRGPEA